MQNIGKSLEALARKLRPYLLPSYFKTYKALIARGLSQRRRNEPIVCCDLSRSAIDAVGGRYYFSLVRDLIDAGYFPVFVAHRGTLSTFGTAPLKSSLLGERLGVIRSLGELQEPFFLITDQETPPALNAKRTVKVLYEHRRSREPHELEFPVFVHPDLTRKVALPYQYSIEARRPTRLFFGGNTMEGKYNQAVLRDFYGMLTRKEMLEITTSEFKDSGIARPDHAETWLDSKAQQMFVLCETQYCQIPQSRWLDALAKADFFLACPGVGMPLCHNLIEALAAGSIPILQYASYLPRPLENGVNCLTFTCAQTLRSTLRRVMESTPEEINALRLKVKLYYDETLAPGKFSEALFRREQTTLLINAYRVPRP